MKIQRVIGGTTQLEILFRWFEQGLRCLIIGTLIHPLRENRQVTSSSAAEDGAATDAALYSDVLCRKGCEIGQGRLVWLINLEDTQTYKPFSWRKRIYAVF